MVQKWLFKIQLFSRRLSVRSAFFALLALASSLAAVLFAPYVPDKFGDIVGGKAVDSILTMMSSSMLIVVTFSLSSVVAAYTSANQNSIPRATKLIINDSASQSAISIFLGAFIYSVVSLIALSTGYYGEKGRVILLTMTVVVLIAVVIVIIRWVEELETMGSVHESMKRVEEVTNMALKLRIQHPTFQCNPLINLAPNLQPIFPLEVGHIQNIDIESLGKLSLKENIKMYLVNDMGAFLDLQTPLLYVTCENQVCQKTIKKIRSSFSIAHQRTFQNDPRYGLSVLSGIGVKALSPALNDPGTAIDVIGSLVRVLTSWNTEKISVTKKEPKYKNIYFPTLNDQDLMNDAFFELVTEGAKHMQVVKALQKAMKILANTTNEDFKKHALEHLTILSCRTEAEFKLPPDAERVHSDLIIGENQRVQYRDV